VLRKGFVPKRKFVALSSTASTGEASWGLDLRATDYESAARAETEAAAAREALNGSVAALNNYAGLVYDATRIASDPMREVDNA
jgi:hypothetical protein